LNGEHVHTWRQRALHVRLMRHVNMLTTSTTRATTRNMSPVIIIGPWARPWPTPL